MLKNRVNFTKNMESKIRYVPLENKNINNLDQKNFLSDDGEKLVNAKLNRVNYQKISDHMLSGISSYDRVKFWGIIGVGLGLAIMMNLHTLILTALVNIVFKH